MTSGARVSWLAAHIKDVLEVASPRAGRRQILSVGANAAPSTEKVRLIASASVTAAGGRGWSGGQTTMELITVGCHPVGDRQTYRSQHSTAHT